MLLLEDRLDLLIERLRNMGARDRAAVLRLMSTTERRRVEHLLSSVSNGDDVVLTTFSREIAARIEGGEGSVRMTDAGRSALARAVARRQPTAPIARSRSLLDAAAAFAFARRDR